MNKYKSLEAAITGSLSAGLPAATACEQSFRVMNNWLKEINLTHTTIGSSVLIRGALSASIEVVSTAYLGMVRQSISSLRAYYELSLAWLYYKDHPIEWGRIVVGSDQTSLPGEIQKYLRNY